MTSGGAAFQANRVVAIEVPDLDAARRFYGDGLGFRLCSQTDNLLEFDAGDIQLWVKRARELRSFVISLDTPNIPRARAAVLAAGGTIVRGDHSPDGFWFADPFGFVVDVVRAEQKP